MAVERPTCWVCETAPAVRRCARCGMAVCAECDDGQPCQAGRTRSAGSGQAFPAPEWETDGFEEIERAETARRSAAGADNP